MKTLRTIALATAVILTALAIVYVTSERATSSSTTAAPTVCRAIIHRAKLWNHDEEQPAGITASTRWGWGAELDLRVTRDGKVVLVHDDTLKRITGGTDTRRAEDLTFTEVTAIPLARGGRVTGLWRALKTARDAGAKLMLELKRYPQHQAAWDNAGHAYLANAVWETGMTERVFIGGSGAATFHRIRPGYRGFVRVDPDDPTTATGIDQLTWQPDDLIQLGPDHYDAALVADLRAIGHGVASRNAFTAEQVADGLAAGIRTFQEDRGRRLTDHCAEAAS